jgi:hypothetical protein
MAPRIPLRITTRSQRRFFLSDFRLRQEGRLALSDVPLEELRAELIRTEGKYLRPKGGPPMYVFPNFPTKKALSEAVQRGEPVTIFQPGPFGGNEPTEGKVCVEGPHSPKPHSWYATATLKAGKVIKVK